MPLRVIYRRDRGQRRRRQPIPKHTAGQSWHARPDRFAGAGPRSRSPTSTSTVGARHPAAGVGAVWEDVDLAAGVIRVERSWDAQARVVVEPKSRAGRRRVPVAGVLRDILLEHKMAAGGGKLVVGRGADGDRPFNDSTIAERARNAWRRAGLEPITLHEARHTFASLMIAAGVNAKALASYMGHSSVTITYDRYGHLMPGNKDKAAALLDAYLERANSRARRAAVGDD